MRNTSLRQRDILYNITGASIGRCCIFPDNIGKANVNQHVCIVRVKNEFSPVFFGDVLNSIVAKKQLLENQAGGAREGLNFKNLGEFRIPIPTLPEQKAIAEVLECWDNAIQKYEEKIEKKKNIKKGLMQRVLTGEQRLPGFGCTSGELGIEISKSGTIDSWQIFRLGEIAAIYDGTHTTPNYVDDGIAFYSVEHITNNNFETNRFIAPEVFKKECKRVQIEKGDILMTRIGDIGTSKYINRDVTASFYVSLALLKKKKNTNFEFLNHYIGYHIFQRELWKRTIHVAYPKKINLGEIGECKLQLPPLPEQKAIASVLSDADAEIAALERKLAVLSEQKQYLLNNLVTGTIRLPQFLNTEKSEGVDAS